ncbi:MAG: T9SS type A sorting domain-containing protein [Bacteroidia bacterium]
MKPKSLSLFLVAYATLLCLNSNAQPLVWNAEQFLHSYPQYQSGFQLPQKIVTASDNSVFVAGTFNFTNTFARKIAVLKYDDTGDSITSVVVEDPGFNSAALMNNYVNDMLIDGSDNIYVLGTTSDSVTINGLKYRGTSLLLKYDKDLNLEWQRHITHADMNSIIFDSNGNICLNGSTKNNGDGTLTNMFTVVFDNNGNELWRRRYASAGAYDDKGADIAADGSGNVYIIGTSNVAGNGKQLVTIKYDASGNTQWRKFFNTYLGAGAKDQAGSVAVSASGNVYISGVVTTGFSNVASRTMLVCYNTNGTKQWNKKATSTQGTYSLIPAKIRIDANENVYVCSTRQPYSTTQFTNNNKHIQVRKYSSSGVLQWSAIKDTASVYDFDVTPVGDIYISGSKNNPFKFYAAKYNTGGTLDWEDIYAPLVYNDQVGSGSYGTCLSINQNNANAVTFGAFAQAAQPGSIYSTEWMTRQYNTAPRFGNDPQQISTEPLNELNVYPNPAQNQIFISSTVAMKDATVSIKNLVGQSVKNISMNGFETSIGIGDLKSGIYVIDAINDGKHFMKKFVKQ